MIRIIRLRPWQERTLCVLLAFATGYGWTAIGFAHAC